MIAGRVMMLIFFQLAADKSPISQNTMDCNSFLEIAKRIVMSAEKRKVIATPARSSPVELAE